MFQIISILAAFQALFFSILILTKKNKSRLDKYLSSWLILLSVNIVCISVSQNEKFPESVNVVYPGYILAGLHGFFLYLCTKSLINNSAKDFKNGHIAFMGYLLFALIGFLLYRCYPTETSIISRIVAFLWNGLFVILAVRLFHYYKKFMVSNFSNIQMLSVEWMRFLAIGLVVLLSGALILAVLHEFFSYSFSLHSAFAVVVFLFVNVLGFRGITQSNLFNQIVIPYKEAQTDESSIVNKENAYANYGLKQEEAIFLSNNLTRYMQKEKPYLTMDLTLKDLAIALDTYPHYITQVLNTVFNQNFYDFINNYRVEEVKDRLRDSHYQDLTVLAIAYDCGFNSKSTFNWIFKQKTGMTPTQYRNY